MRWMVVGLGMVLLGFQMGVAGAAEDEEPGTGKRILGGVISGLLGGPQPSAGAAYTEQEKERLVWLLQGGEYVTSRQGEPVDVMAYGIPLTHIDHVYTARPISPSRTSSPHDRR